MTLPFNFTRQKRRNSTGEFIDPAPPQESTGQSVVSALLGGRGRSVPEVSPVTNAGEFNAGAVQTPVFGQDDTRPPAQPQGSVSGVLPDIVSNFLRQRNERPLETRDTSLTTGPTPRPAMPYQGTENEQGEIIAPIGAQSTGEMRPRVNNPELTKFDPKTGHPYGNPHAPDGLEKDIALARETAAYQPKKLPKWWERLVPLILQGGFRGLATGDWASGLGGALAGTAVGLADPKAADKMWRARASAEANANAARGQQQAKTQADLDESKANTRYKNVLTEAAAGGKWTKVKQGGVTYMVNSNNPSVGHPITDASGAPLPPDQRKPVVIDMLNPENGVEVGKGVLGEDGTVTPVTTQNGQPVVSKRAEGISTTTGVKAGTDATNTVRREEGAANRSSREEIARQNRASAERRAALKISNTGALTATEQRQVKRRIRTLKAEEERYEATGQHQMALQKRKEREGYEQELSGAQSPQSSGGGQTWFGKLKNQASGQAPSTGEFAGKVTYRSRLPEFAKIWGVSEAEAEQRIIRGGGTIK